MGDELEWSEYGDGFCWVGDSGEDSAAGAAAVAVKLICGLMVWGGGF